MWFTIEIGIVFAYWNSDWVSGNDYIFYYDFEVTNKVERVTDEFGKHMFTKYMLIIWLKF